MAQHRLRFKTPFAGVQGGPRTSPLPAVPRGRRAAHTGAAPGTPPAAENSCVTGAPGVRWLRGHGLFTVQCSPQSGLASPASPLEFAISLQPGARHHVPSSLLGPGCRLFFPCCFQQKKEHFFPTLLPIKEETRKQDKNSSMFGGVFLLFCDRGQGLACSNWACSPSYVS